MCFTQLIIWILLLLFATPAFAELTQKDLEAIQDIVKTEITELEKRTDLKFQIVNTKFDAVHTRIDEVDKRLVDLRNIVIALVAIIAIPTAALTYAARKFADVTSATKELSQIVKDNAEATKILGERLETSNEAYVELMHRLEKVEDTLQIREND